VSVLQIAASTVLMLPHVCLWCHLYHVSFSAFCCDCRCSLTR